MSTPKKLTPAEKARLRGASRKPIEDYFVRLAAKKKKKDINKYKCKTNNIKMIFFFYKTKQISDS